MNIFSATCANGCAQRTSRSCTDFRAFQVFTVGRRSRQKKGRTIKEATMKPELLYLVCVTLLTALMWVPYILDRMAARGILDTVGYPDSPKPQSAWAKRMMSAHSNAIENLV